MHISPFTLDHPASHHGSSHLNKGMRDAHIDNTKGFLIFLVVFGHAITPFIDTEATYRAVFDFVYSFHIPLFVFISGMFSKRLPFREALRQNTSSILFIFLVFHALYELSDFLIRGELSYYTRHFQPYWLTWYLWSLFIWRVAISVLPKRNSLFLASLAVAVVFNMTVHGYLYFAINKTIRFFPFFVAGYLQGRNIVNLALRLPAWLAVGFTGIALFYFLNTPDFKSQVFFHADTLLDIYGSPATAFVATLAAYLFSSAMSLAILRLMPHRRSVLTGLGERSLYAYLWHGFIIRVLVMSGLDVLLTNSFPSPANLAAILAIAGFITWIVGNMTVYQLSTRMIMTLKSLLASAFAISFGRLLPRWRERKL